MPNLHGAGSVAEPNRVLEIQDPEIKVANLHRPRDLIMKKLILTLAVLFCATTLCRADALDDLKTEAASGGFSYKGIDHISAGSFYYRFANGTREVWIPVSIKYDLGEITLAWATGQASAFWTWTQTTAAAATGK